MGMLEMQYQQYYAMAAVPPFDPNPVQSVVNTPLVAGEALVPVTVVTNGTTGMETLLSPTGVLPDLIPQNAAALVSVPLMQIPIFTSMQMTPFMSVDENILKEYIRKQV